MADVFLRRPNQLLPSPSIINIHTVKLVFVHYTSFAFDLQPLLLQALQPQHWWDLHDTGLDALFQAAQTPSVAVIVFTFFLLVVLVCVG